MSNRTDFDNVVLDILQRCNISRRGLSVYFLEQVETELHNAYIAGEEGYGCECQWCSRASQAGVEHGETQPMKIFDLKPNGDQIDIRPMTIKPEKLKGRKKVGELFGIPVYVCEHAPETDKAQYGDHWYCETCDEAGDCLTPRKGENR